MGYWVKPGHLPEAIDISDFGGPASEISSELTRIAERAILHSQIRPAGPIRTAGPLRPIVEIADRTFADEDSIVAGFAERPTDVDTEKTHVDHQLVAALRRQGRVERRTRRPEPEIRLPTSFAPAPRGERPAYADPPTQTVLPPDSLASPHVQWDPTASIDAVLVTSDLELDFEDSTPAEVWPGGPVDEPVSPPVNHSQPAPLQTRYVEPVGPANGPPRAGASIRLLLWVGLAFAAAMVLTLGVVASIVIVVL